MIFVMMSTKKITKTHSKLFILLTFVIPGSTFIVKQVKTLLFFHPNTKVLTSDFGFFISTGNSSLFVRFHLFMLLDYISIFG